MWRSKQTPPSRDHGPLEGRLVEVGKLKLHVKSTIAQGGFSYVYHAKCGQTQRTYALKHILANDREGSELIEREINVMMTLRAHPHIITLHAHSKVTEGRRVEYFLAMDYCDKMLVSVMESRGKNHYDEKQLLLIFRDVCNAVHAMHSRSPPIAHRDLKAENVLLGSDGLWKLCDFGSTSTNHKRFDTAEEMGVEEDIIRKHTTPAYRAPEMWDLYAREVISEKVDIWALGCLLYRLAYFKSCFDGESKLQILNGNYRIPESPQYSAGLVDLVRRMLASSPEKRPDILQVWRDVNELLPSAARKATPTPLPGAPQPAPPVTRGSQTQASAPPKAATQQQASPGPAPRRSPSPGPAARRPVSPGVPSRAAPSPPPVSSALPPSAGAQSAGAGSFWASQFAPVVQSDDNRSPPSSSPSSGSPAEKLSPQRITLERQLSGSPQLERGDPSQDARGMEGAPEARSSPLPPAPLSPQQLSPKAGPRSGPLIEDFFSESYREKQNQALAEGDAERPRSHSVGSAMPSSQGSTKRPDGSGSSRQDEEIQRLREQLARIQAEKAELEAKCGRLANMVRGQRNEIQDLKSTLAAANSASTAGTANGSHSTVYLHPTSSEKGMGEGKKAGAADSANGGAHRVPSTRVEEGKPSLWLNSELLSDPVSLSDAEAFGSTSGPDPVLLKLRSKPQSTSSSGKPAVAGWQAFDASPGSSASGKEGFGGSAVAPQSRQSTSQQAPSNWATFDSLSSNGSKAPGRGDGLPSVQWETVTVSAAGKVSTNKRSSQPAGWAGF